MTERIAAEICADAMSTPIAIRAWIASLVLRASEIDQEWRWFAAWKLLGEKRGKVLYDTKQF
jgi:hypothetical protein